MLSVLGVGKSYQAPGGMVPALIDVSFRLEAGGFCALTGPSGSGKTTLMNLIGLLDRPDHGEIRLDGHDVSRLAHNHAARLRNRLIGFVFQSFHLLPRLTALENVGLPLLYRGVGRAERLRLASKALARVGLADRAAHAPDSLSGGQRQRVAIARAIVGEPRLLLADEPTGNLDPAATVDILDLFFALNHESGVTVLVVTHDQAVAQRCPRQIAMQAGRLRSDRGGSSA
jgi:putative ABC transport system ATP-binding protein